MSRISSSGGSVSSGGSATLNTIYVTVDFGKQGSPYGENVIGSVTQSVAATWVTASTVFTAALYFTTTADHDPEDPYVEELIAFVTSATPGVGFTLETKAPVSTWGKYIVSVTGVN